MPTPIIAGNWKMNTSLDEAKALVSKMKPDLEAISGVTKVLCPPFVHLTTVKGLIEGTSIKLGAQNMYFEEKGAFTGEVSPAMLVPLCQYVILGHSEATLLDTIDRLNSGTFRSGLVDDLLGVYGSP